MKTYTTDDFLGGRVQLRQETDGLRATSDAVMLAAAVPARVGQTLLDVGVGQGVVALCVAARVQDLILTGVDVQEDLARLAQENSLLNNQKMTVVSQDILMNSDDLKGQLFHHVVTNPPFYDEPRARKNTQTAVAYQARFSIDKWLNYCLKHLRPKGTFTMIHRPEALPEILPLLAIKLGAIEVIPLYPKVDQPAKRVIIRGVLGSKKPLVMMRGIVMHDDDNAPTPVADAILRHGVEI